VAVSAARIRQIGQIRPESGRKTRSSGRVGYYQIINH